MDENRSLEQANTQSHKKTNRLAIISLILGVLGSIMLIIFYRANSTDMGFRINGYLISSYFIWVVPFIGLAAVVIGSISRDKIEKNIASEKGDLLASVGIVLGMFAGIISIGYLLLLLLLGLFLEV